MELGVPESQLLSLFSSLIPHPMTFPLLWNPEISHLPKHAHQGGPARSTVLGNRRLTCGLEMLAFAVVHAFQSLKPKKNCGILGIRKLKERETLLVTF